MKPQFKKLTLQRKTVIYKNSQDEKLLKNKYCGCKQTTQAQNLEQKRPL